MISRRTFVATGVSGLSAGAVTSCRGPGGRRVAMETPATPDDMAWRSVRAQFDIAPDVAYLNNASIGLPPAVVAKAVCDGYQAASRDPIQAKHDLQDLIANRLRPNIAGFLGAEPSEISLTRNATEALHLAATGLRLTRGDEVIITTQEHPAGRRPWHYLAATRGLDVKEVFVPSPFETADHVMNLLSGHITARTKAMAFCHVTRGGHLYPVKQLAAMARERDIATLVDGAQAVGMFPVDLHDLGCDAYAASLHKWVLAPMGTGFLYVRDAFKHRMASAYDPVQPEYQPPGTADLPVKAGIDTALSFIGEIGIETIGRRNRHLSDYLKTKLEGLPSARLLSGPTPETSAPGSTIFELEGVDAVGAVPVLAGRGGLHIDEHARDGHNAIRVSTHFYNTTEELDRLVAALGGMAAG